MARTTSTVPIKAMMAGLGIAVGPCRAPLGLMTEDAVNVCREALCSVYENAPEVLTPIEAAFGVKIWEQLRNEGAWAKLAR